MKKHFKVAKGTLCSLASVLSSGVLMVSNVSAATIEYFSGNTANNDDGVSTLSKDLRHYDYSARAWVGDSSYRGLYEIGSINGVLDSDNAAPAGVAAFEGIIEAGFEFKDWKTSYYRWNRWNDNGSKTAGTNFSSTDYNVRAVAQWTDLKKAVFANGSAERMVVGTPFEVMNEDVKIGEIKLDYKINTTRDVDGATEKTPLKVTSVDEKITFAPDESNGYELKKVDVKIGEAEAVPMIDDVENNVLTLSDVKKDVAIDAEMGLKEFTVAAEIQEDSEVAHAYVKPDFEGDITYGSDAIFSVFVNKGYKVATIRESGGLTPYEVVDGKLVIENVKNDMSLNIVVVPEEYIVMDGDAQIFDASKGEDLVFRFSGEADLFEGLYIDGKLVDKENYSVELGSTIVAVSNKFVADNYGEGAHDVLAVYKNDTFVKTTFTIAPKAPETGANSRSSVNTVASAAAFAVTGAGLALAVLYIKRKMNR